MKYEIKRRHIISALRYNNLVAGSWIQSEYRKMSNAARKTVEIPSCAGCLVGNTLNRALPKKLSYQKLDEIGAVIGRGSDFNYAPDRVNSITLKELLNEKLYLAALSHLFEGTIRPKARKKFGYGFDDLDVEQIASLKLTDDDTERLIKWVKENIPVTFKIKV